MLVVRFIPLTYLQNIPMLQQACERLTITHRKYGCVCLGKAIMTTVGL